MDTDNHLIQCISRYPCPVLLGAPEQLRQMQLQTIPAGVFPIDTIIPLLQCQEVVMDIAEIIEHITHAHILRMFAHLIFIGFHGFSRITPLSLTSGRQARSLATTLVMPANVIL